MNLEMVIQDFIDKDAIPPNLNLDKLRKQSEDSFSRRFITTKFNNLQIQQNMKSSSPQKSFNHLSSNEAGGEMYADMVIAKQKNQQIYATICNGISQLMWLGCTTDKLDMLTPLQIKLDKISAYFIKCPVEKKLAPMKIMFREFHRADSNTDVQVFWSFTNPYPCEGGDKDCDGFFD